MVALLLVLLLLMPVSAQAAQTITLEWELSPGATSSDVEKSVDLGKTWTVAAAQVPLTACKGTPRVCRTAYTFADTGLVLFRITERNAQGTTTRTHAGPWYNAAWSLPGGAKSSEIK